VPRQSLITAAIRGNLGTHDPKGKRLCKLSGIPFQAWDGDGVEAPAFIFVAVVEGRQPDDGRRAPGSTPPQPSLSPADSRPGVPGRSRAAVSQRSWRRADCRRQGPFSTMPGWRWPQVDGRGGKRRAGAAQPARRDVRHRLPGPGHEMNRLPAGDACAGATKLKNIEVTISSDYSPDLAEGARSRGRLDVAFPCAPSRPFDLGLRGGGPRTAGRPRCRATIGSPRARSSASRRISWARFSSGGSNKAQPACAARHRGLPAPLGARHQNWIMGVDNPGDGHVPGCVHPRVGADCPPYAKNLLPLSVVKPSAGG